ncbi:MAG: hypothetical protein LR011_14710, partial [Verrucomicrobia bacterium]|nr:hypothetical protein [Verrucomicrobiota bacterium]
STRHSSARGRMDAFLAKYDEAGRLVWVQQAGSTSTVGTTERADRVALDGNGHVYVAGLFKAVGLFGSGSDAPQLVSAGEADYFVAQYDESGNVNWAIRIGTELDDTLIGDLAADGLGNVYFSFLGYPGTMVRDTTGIHSVPDIGSGDICTVKINSDGNFQWAVVIGSSFNDSANALAVAPNGDLLVSGIFFWCWIW